MIYKINKQLILEDIDADDIKDTLLTAGAGAGVVSASKLVGSKKGAKLKKKYLDKANKHKVTSAIVNNDKVKKVGNGVVNVAKAINKTRRVAKTVAQPKRAVKVLTKKHFLKDERHNMYQKKAEAKNRTAEAKEAKERYDNAVKYSAANEKTFKNRIRDLDSENQALKDQLTAKQLRQSSNNRDYNPAKAE